MCLFLVYLLFHFYSKTAPILFTGQPVLTHSTRKSVNTLTCRARSIPIPDLTWFQVKNGVPIEQSNSTDTSVYHTVEDEYTLTVTLQLAPINDLNVTGYFCRGSNGLFHNDSNMIHIMDSETLHVQCTVYVNIFSNSQVLHQVL